MKYVHKPIEVEAMKFTLTEAKNPDSLAFSQFGIQDRSKTNSWSYWKTPESLTVPGRFFLRTKQHSTMMVAVGDWVVKDSTGHVTLMDDKRFNELYRAKQPPQEDWREVIKTSGLSYDKIKEAYAKVLPKTLYETPKPTEAHWLKHTQDGLLGRNHDHIPDTAWIEPVPPSAIGAIMEAEAKRNVNCESHYGKNCENCAEPRQMTMEDYE